jgi:hypothetical protein
MRCEIDLKADNALHPAPQRRLPAIDFELFRIEFYGGQSRIGASLLVCSSILGPQLEPASAPIGSVGQPVDRETQVGQDRVVDDIVEKNGIRIEGFLRQDDAIIECAVLADGDLPGIAELSL